MKTLFSSLFLLSTLIFFGQNPLSKNHSEDSVFIRQLFDTVLISGECHENLRELCKDIGHRLTGSPASYKAVKWGESKMKSMAFDSVWLQEIKVPHWVRGSIERCDFSNKNTPLYVSSCTALGGSVGTEGEVLRGKVIEVRSWEEMTALGKDQIENKIVFINRPMNPAMISTFSAYGDCSGYRVFGASEAAKYGAKAIVLRSLTLKEDENPHTGVMYYKDSLHKIPAVAVSSYDANKLHLMLTEDENTEVRLKLDSKMLPDTVSYNVVGEIRGTEFPDEIILVGGHLDSWDIGEGAHDDGAGVVHSMEALRILMHNGYQPKRTIRCVLYMNEENGNRGGKGYAKYAKEYEENHIFALETDRGGFSPRGFSVDGKAEDILHLKQFSELFLPYFIHFIEKGYGGVDIGPLKKSYEDITLVGLVPDSQRYFDFHHAPSDVWENVNKRELELGSGAIASLIYLVDKYGMP